MLWFTVLLYVAVSPVACLLIGGAIRVREVERPTCSVEPSTDGVEATPAVTPVATGPAPAPALQARAS